MKVRSTATVLSLFVLLAACSTAPPSASDLSPTPAPAPAETTPVPAAEASPPPPPPAAATAPDPSETFMEPQHARLQHILIGFQGTVPGKNITRSQEEARALATELLARAREGEDFGALVKQYTDDQAPGLYSVANRLVTPGQGEFAREKMIPAFGDVGFRLQVGEIGMAEYDPRASPYGWHIIKRIS